MVDDKQQIAFSNICKSFSESWQQKTILDQTEITLKKGECYLLSGKNGSGKSTLLRIMAGLVKPNQASITLAEKTFTWKQARPQIRQQIMYLYQEPYMFDGSVYRNLQYALDAKDHDKIMQALQWAKLEHREKTQAKCLSGGEKQRLALAQAWLKKPAYLLLDEPTANMDKHSKQRTGELLAEFKASNTALLIASHDLDHLLPIMDKRLILENGKLFETEQ